LEALQFGATSVVNWSAASTAVLFQLAAKVKTEMFCDVRNYPMLVSEHISFQTLLHL